MIGELQTNAFKLPVYTIYNHTQIPFAYPPLPLYFTGVLQSITGIDLFTLLRLLPALFSSLSVPAFFLFSRCILGNETHAFIAALIFAIQPESFEWEIMGGGITRAPAYLFSILALYQAHQMLTLPPRRYCIWTGLFLGLAALCHLQIAFTSLTFILLMVFFFGDNRDKLFRLITAGLVMGAVTAPYWISVLFHHGIYPFIHAFSSGEFAIFSSLIKLALVHLTIFNSLMVIFILLGWFGQVIRRNYFLPIFLVVGILIDPRSPARSGIPPGAMLASIALLDFIIPSFQSLSLQNRSRNIEPASRWGWIILFYLLILSIFSTLVPQVTGDSSLSPLSKGDRLAMQWVSEHTDSSARFLVLTPTTIWAYDKIAEWFPALTGRSSLSTVQGCEWLPNNRFEIQKVISLELKKCSAIGLDCLEQVVQKYSLENSHIYLSDFPWRATRLEIELNNSAQFKLIYEQDGVVIYTRSVPQGQ